MTSTLLDRTTLTDIDGRPVVTTCQAWAGSLLAPCPNRATTSVVRRGAERVVCPAHA
jgi:hypothetical protein